MVASQAERFERFRALHTGPAFILPNAWAGASAVLLERAGFAALGSTSIAIAFAMGRQDGLRQISRDEAIANAALLARLTGLPVNGDLEDGFGPNPGDCALTVEAAVAGGLAGLGIEDTTADPADPIHGFDQAVARVRGAAEAARGRILLTGRTDLLINGSDDLDAAIRRLVAFAEVGADVLFAPGLRSMDAVRAVVRAVAPKPVNVVVGPGVTLAELDAAGVRRVSLGGGLYRRAMAGVIAAAEQLREGDIPAALRGIPTSAEIGALLPGG